MSYEKKYLKYKIKYNALRYTLNNFEKFNQNFSISSKGTAIEHSRLDRTPNKNKYQQLKEKIHYFQSGGSSMVQSIEKNPDNKYIVNLIDDDGDPDKFDLGELFKPNIAVNEIDNT